MARRCPRPRLPKPACAILPKIRTAPSTPVKARTTARARTVARARADAPPTAPSPLQWHNRQKGSAIGRSPPGPHAGNFPIRRSLSLSFTGQSPDLSKPEVFINFKNGHPMPGNRFNAFQNHGVGIGLRIPHYAHIFSRKPVVDWFEIISENFMIDAGRPLVMLDRILDQYRVVQHGVSRSEEHTSELQSLR